jgi:hypothetical protein
VINKEDAEIGQTVYPRAFTKQAPRECYLGLAAVLVSVDEWPMVIVRIFDDPDQPRGREIKLHRDNVGLHRKTVKREKDGDRVGGTEGPMARVPVLGKPVQHPVLF